MEPKLMLRQQLADLVCEAITERRWTQRDAARHLSTSQPQICALQKGKLEHLSSDLLVTWLGELDRGVKVEACQLTQEFYSKREQDPYAHLAQGRSYLDQGIPYGALLWGRILLRDFPNFQPGRQLMHEAYVALGDVALARKYEDRAPADDLLWLET